MILIDLSQIMVASTMMSMGKEQSQVDISMVRHMVLNSLRMYRSKYHGEYGELVLCCDGRHSWRREHFPQYKASRKSNREADSRDWSQIFGCLDTIKSELKEFFPYKYLEIDTAEADDIIATLVNLIDERTLILSSDKDFVQLHQFNIRQYSPMQKKFVDGDAKRCLHEKLIKGDVGDGVPNIMSDDNVFIDEGRRQKPVTKKKVDAWYDLDPEMYCNAEMLRNYNRNKQLIDLSEVPESIRINITKQFETTQVGERNRLLTYFVNHRLKNLTENLSEF